jgi:glycyl-tRNA synthetase beta chain
VLVHDLETQAADQSQEILGPPADRARDEHGNWSKAAQGFARKNDVDPDSLEILDTPKGARLALCRTAPGARITDCLESLLEHAVNGLPIPKRMRWGSSRNEFVRPVHWLLALLGDTVVDCEILGLKSGRETRGHRFHCGEAKSLGNATEYEATLKSAYVIADFDRRRETIRHQVLQQAQTLNAIAIMDEDLLDEVTALVEWPVALSGSFEERFLDVPAEALISSMQEHQKYFPVTGEDGELLPHFIAVANLESRDPAQVVDGNERVIRPRLSDAEFFFQTDRQSPLADLVERLGSITFQQKLGSLLDKTRRLEQLARWLAPYMGANPDQAQRAALLSKADLLTQLVGEFPDLQGIAGRYYAQHDGEPEDVAWALEQQYRPRFAGDQLPEGPVATTLALADRLDTLIGIFGVGLLPSGSRDPFALRRASLGVLRIIVENELPIDVQLALQTAFDQFPAGTLQADAVSTTVAYILDRFGAWYEEAEVPIEVVKAVEAEVPIEVVKAVSAMAITEPLDIDRRVKAVHAFLHMPEAASLAAANKRVSNILAKQATDLGDLEVSEGLLTEPAERRLAVELAACQPVVRQALEQNDYSQALASLARLKDPVDQFFDQVMVMTEDPSTRNNRLALLQDLRATFYQVADISQLAPGK